MRREPARRARTASWRRSPNGCPPKIFAIWLRMYRGCAEVRTRLGLLLGFALVLAACGKQESADRGPPATAPAATSASTPRAAADQQQTAARSHADASKMTLTNEDGSEKVEDTTGD